MNRQGTMWRCALINCNPVCSEAQYPMYHSDGFDVKSATDTSGALFIKLQIYTATTTILLNFFPFFLTPCLSALSPVPTGFHTALAPTPNDGILILHFSWVSGCLPMFSLFPLLFSFTDVFFFLILTFLILFFITPFPIICSRYWSITYCLHFPFLICNFFFFW